MKLNTRYILNFCLLPVLLLLSVTSILFAQNSKDERKLVQLTGYIKNIDTDDPVPYVTVQNLNFRNEAYVASHLGYFSIVAHEGDSILLTSIGYSPVTYVVPASLDNRHTAFIRMTSLVSQIEMVEPYPYASVEEFNQAFLALDIADDNLTLAKRNLSRESIAAMARNLPYSGQEMRVINTNQQHLRMANQNFNQRLANPLLNPFAWGNLLRQISEGNFSRSKNNW